MGRVAHPPQNHQPRAVTPRHLTTTPAGPASSAPFLRGLFRRAPVLARLALAVLLLVSGLAAPTAAQQFEDGDLRLCDDSDCDSSNLEGALQIYFNGQWGAVCDDVFERTTNGAMVACRQLGLTGGAYNSAFESSAATWPGSYLRDDVRCIGSESRLTECRHAGFGRDGMVLHNCGTRESEGVFIAEQAGVTCNQVSEVKVEFGAATYMLDEGSSVDVTVTLSEAPGRELTIPLVGTDNQGLPFNAPESVTFGSSETSKMITVSVADDVAFTSDPRTITLGFRFLPVRVSAGTTAETVITVNEDDAPPPSNLRDGDLRLCDDSDCDSSNSEGALQVFHDGQWGAVCDDGLNRPGVEERATNFAVVACRQLGLTGGAYNSDFQSSAATWPGKYSLNNVRCKGTESRLVGLPGLTGCNHAGLGNHNCEPREEQAGVTCDGPDPLNIDNDISGLTEARRESAAILLIRHADRFPEVSSSAALTRLQGLAPPTTVNAQISARNHKLDASWNGDGAKDSGWAGWSRLFYGWVEGPGDGAVYDLYLGVDWRAPDGRYVIGGLLGHDGANLRLDDGEGRFRSQISMIGIYGATYLNDALILDGALAYGFGRPKLSMVEGGDRVTAEYDTERFTIRADLTGGISWSEGAVVVEPQAGVLYVRERLGAFTDSTGAPGAAETLRLTRFGVGPRLTWALPNGVFTGRARLNWDRHNLDGDGDKVSDISASLDARLRYHLEGGLSAEFFGAADGIGLPGDQQTYTAGVSLNFRF